MSIDGIRKEIEAKEARQAELQNELSEAGEEATAAVEALADGGGALETAEEAATRRGTLQQAADAVAGQLEALRAELEAAEAEEKRTRTLEHLEALAEEAGEWREEQRTCKRELAEALEELSGRHAEAVAKRGQARRKFRQAARQVREDPKALCRLLEGRGADLRGVLPRYGRPGLEWPATGDEDPDLGAWTGKVNGACKLAANRREG